MTRTRAEHWLLARLAKHGVAIAESGEPRERIRRAIEDAGLECVIALRGRDRKAITYARVFEMLYGAPLKPAEPRRRT